MSEKNNTSRKAMVFDVDKSLTTLGGIEKQEEIFGIPPVSVFGGLDTMNSYLDQILEIKRIPLVHPLLGESGEEAVIDFNKKALDMGLSALIIDSITILGVQERDVIKNKEGIAVMDQRSWGLYGDAMIKFINKLSKARFIVICTAHIKRDQDENGSPIEIPALKGSAALDCGRYFDVIAYSKVNKDAQGRATEYSWIVSSDRRHIMAKNRGGILGSAPIPQDLNLIINTYKEHGFEHPKILILGDSGQGKTWSLQTLNENKTQETQ